MLTPAASAWTAATCRPACCYDPTAAQLKCALVTAALHAVLVMHCLMQRGRPPILYPLACYDPLWCCLAQTPTCLPVLLLIRQVSEAEEGLLHTEFAAPKAQQQQQQWARALHLLLWVFGVSGAYCLVAAWVKALRYYSVQCRVCSSWHCFACVELLRVQQALQHAPAVWSVVERC